MFGERAREPGRILLVGVGRGPGTPWVDAGSLKRGCGSQNHARVPREPPQNPQSKSKSTEHPEHRLGQQTRNRSDHSVRALPPRAHERVSTRANACSRRPKQSTLRLWDITRFPPPPPSLRVITRSYKSNSQGLTGERRRQRVGDAGAAARHSGQDAERLPGPAARKEGQESNSVVGT